MTGTGVETSRIPAAVNKIDAKQFEAQSSPSVVSTMLINVPSVSSTNESGNSFEPDLQFRGFLATPITGTPIGLAVYQNGVRINEAFGDNVHWDFIPPDAIHVMDIVTANPIFGLNALGGAVVVQMKNGFTYQGAENDFVVGSFGRVQDSFQWGKQDGNYAAYFAIDGAYENGFRERSSSTIRRLYGDVGYKDEQSEIHLNVTAADNFFNAPATTPVELLKRDYSAVYTTPQSDDLQMGMISLQGNTKLSDTRTLAGTLYYRHLSDKHVDGNDTDVQVCDDPTLLCFTDGTTPAIGSNGQQLPNLFPEGAVLGQIDRNSTRTNGWGGTLQITDTAKLRDMDNTFVLGASLDMAGSNFNANSELGTADPDTLVITGNGQYLGYTTSDEGSIGPVKLRTRNTYVGVYALDTLDVTKKFTLTLGGRFNFANIDLTDLLQTGPGSLTGDHQYARFNPVIGGTYKITPDVVGYASYSESNRAPTPLELGCSDPNLPCVIDTFLVSDPNLDQVVSRTVELGLRGKTNLSGNQTLGWKLGLYRTDNSNDILNVVAPIGMTFGYFANVGKTRREGIEAAVNYTKGDWSAFASYAYVDATYQSYITLNPPSGDPAGDEPIQVVPGDHISRIPAHHFKLGVDYKVNDKWTVGGNVLAVGSQNFGGDESNENPKLPGYATVDLHTTYQITKNMQFHAEIENLFNTKYYLNGTYFDNTSSVGSLVGGHNTDTVTPGKPFAVYAGLKVTF
ncbi:TonB-dependent receptor [Mesorhizobium sp. KR1-2]|uniref:TonB-dependent receptor n=1 Tax=Mesorhizobium sp. KR1-2 TaxID=3156609 RepID=UPI0032B4A643